MFTLAMRIVYTSSHQRRRLVEARVRLLGQIRDSPRDGGRIVLVACRPAVGVRELPGEALLDPAAGLAGDNWLARGSTSMPDGSADPQRQVTVMNARVAELVAGGTDRMALSPATSSTSTSISA